MHTSCSVKEPAAVDKYKHCQIIQALPDYLTLM